MAERGDGPARRALRRARIGAVVLAAVTTSSVAVGDDEVAAPEPDWDAAYDRLVARGEPHYLRAVLEEAALIGAGATWYWLDRERQVADWDYPSLRQRLTFEAWRFDNNPFPINFAWHAIDGGAYHLVGRTNELSLLASVGFGLVTSFAWEYGLEFREKVSINDTIVTTGAGTALGEFAHWLGRYLESAPDPRGWHAIARWTLTTFRAAHNALDDREVLRAGTSPDALGLSDDIWHRFLLSSGLAYGAVSGDVVTGGDDRLALGEVRAAGELVAIPGFLRARRLRRGFADGNVTAASLRVTGGDDAVGVELFADTFLVGWLAQDLDAAGDGRATTVGMSLAYRYRRELLGPWTERLGQMHLPGLGVDHHLRAGDLRVVGRARAWPDFAGVHAEAYPAWKAANPDAVDKAILRKHGYYYGWGGTGRVEIEAIVPRGAAGASLSYSRYDSQEGLDRTQEDVTVDVDAGDTVLAAEAWLRVAPRAGRFYLEARFISEDRRGHVGEVDSDRALRRLAVAVGAEL